MKVNILSELIVLIAFALPALSLAPGPNSAIYFTTGFAVGINNAVIPLFLTGNCEYSAWYTSQQLFEIAYMDSEHNSMSKHYSLLGISGLAELFSLISVVQSCILKPSQNWNSRKKESKIDALFSEENVWGYEGFDIQDSLNFGNVIFYGWKAFESRSIARKSRLSLKNDKNMFNFGYNLAQTLVSIEETFVGLFLVTYY